MTRIEAIDLFNSLGAVNEAFVEAADADRARKKRSRLSKTARLAILAAALAALLVVSAVAAQTRRSTESGVIGWFDTLSERQGAAPLTDAQKSAITALTCPGGISDTASGITVTAESLTVGRFSVSVLLSVASEEGMLDPEATYRFEMYRCVPEIQTDRMTAFGFSQSFYLFDPESEKAYIVLSFDADELIMEGIKSAGSLPIQLEDLQLLNNAGDVLDTINGHWELPLSLSASQTLETVEFDELSVHPYLCFSYPFSFRLPGRMTLRDVSITEADISFRFDAKYAQDLTIFGKSVAMRFLPVSAVLKNGAFSPTGGAVSSNDGEFLCCYRWEVPISLTEVDYIRFGSTKIYLSK